MQRREFITLLGGAASGCRSETVQGGRRGDAMMQYIEFFER
jgi:hypothetical protein